MASEGRYIPAAGHAALTRFYDPFMTLTMRERAWRPALGQRILDAVPESGTIVDLGAGTGRNAIDLASARPDVEVIAVDGDSEALELAQAKPGAERIAWREGLAGQLDLPDASADAIVISLVLHHLTPGAKRAALTDAHRVLRPTGRLHIADWGRAHDPLMRVAFFAAQLLDGFATTSDHAAGRIPDYLTDAGFTSTTWRRVRTPGGSLDLIEAKPADESQPA
jgi:ubiquinone/menaquinone biosynthesis C-methylase UbiE